LPIRSAGGAAALRRADSKPPIAAAPPERNSSRRLNHRPKPEILMHASVVRPSPVFLRDYSVPGGNAMIRLTLRRRGGAIMM
jgi:hypothetical protein